MSACDYVLGTKVSLLQIPDVIAEMEQWITEARGRGPARYAVLTNVNCVMSARRDPRYRRVLNHADWALADGMSLVWVTRARGASHMLRRCYGPEIFAAFCERARARGWKFYLYGGAEGVAENLSAALRDRHPGIQIVGWDSPPFRPLTHEEDDAACDRINRSGADIVWVGLGSPKQDIWMAEHASRLRTPVLVGVGAAFDFFTGRVTQAPRWMRENGLEWLFRLFADPRRLWFRYLVYNPWFAWLLLLESLHLKRFSRD
jgi:N-acetylglucosaminyldiphosphoundecaprenol N-acetyl-beta-D-mannosaminyltransferase